MKHNITLITALLLAPLAALHAADLSLASVFTDHAVLQREMPIAVWGRANPGEKIVIEFAGQKKSATTDESGKWMVKLDAMAASDEPRELVVESEIANRKMKIADVLVGDVWLCSGQSNMAMTIDGKTGWLYIGGVANAKEEVRNSTNPLLRQFCVDWKTDTKPQENCTGKWTAAGLDTTADFTATGYFFARELHRRLQIPIGIINASFGGSSVEGWTSREALTKEADAEFVAKMNKLMDDYDNHEQLVTNYVATLAKWEATCDRADPGGALNEDAADWKKVVLPASLAKLGCADGGVVWLRREIDVPAEFGNAWRFDFPACRAFYAVYLNDVKIFEATPANALGSRPSRPAPGKSVARPGKNRLAIKLHAQSGGSGITGGAFAIVPYNPKFQAVPLAGEWLCRAEKGFAPLPKDADPMPVAPVRGTLHWMPVPSQYNAMLHPLVPFAMKGAAWYQGESNVGNPRYAKHLKILITDWRRRWGIGDFPFYLCQLPGFGARTNTPVESAWAECREAQTAALELPNTGIANLIDTCEDGDLHPLNKQDAGSRLALVALANTYGFKDLVWSGPLFDSMKIAEGKAFITFKHADGGLVAKTLPATYRPNLRKPELPPKPLQLPSPGSELQGFSICNTTNHWVNAQAKIDGTRVIVWSDEVKNPTAVRYAWADHPVCNLYNKAGQPAFPFRTDKLSGVGIAGNLAFETSSFMRETVHAGRKAPPKDWQSQSGAMGVNAKWEADHSLPWFIEDQRFGGDYISAGLAFGNKDQTRWGLKVLAWGFARMEADGEFKHPDSYHSASFFIESAAHGLLLIEASPWREELAEPVAAIKPKLLTAARWMARPDVHVAAWEDPKNWRGERPYAHRRYLDAAAMGEVGLLFNDKELIAKSAALVRDGIAFQRADGVNPEKGGYDSHYQALGLVYACEYYAMVADDALRQEMKPMLDKAFAWLLTRIKDDGTVDATGNTRTGLSQEAARSGKPKGIEYRHIIRSLAHWSQLTQNTELESTARRVFEADRKSKPR